MRHHFQTKDGDYVAAGTAYRILAASKTPCMLPGIPTLEPIDLMELSSTEKALGEMLAKSGFIGDVPDDWAAFDRLTSDPVLAWHALYFLCHDEYDDTERIAFIKSIDDASFQPAMKALIGALADFFDSLNRPLTASALRTSIEAAERLVQEAREELQKNLTADRIVSECKRRAGGGSSSSWDPSEFLQGIPGSGPSTGSKKSSGTRKAGNRTK